MNEIKNKDNNNKNDDKKEVKKNNWDSNIYKDK